MSMLAPATNDLLLFASNLAHSFDGVRALAGIDFWVERGEAVGLLGQNGSGKTTLLNVLTGQIRPQSGSISFNGRQMVGAPPELFARVGIARVFQSVQVFPRLTALENLMACQMNAAGRSTHDRAAALRILERVRLPRDDIRLARELSYGDQRLLEIAMALAVEADLILLDEPAAGLNSAMVDQVIDVLHEVNAAGVALVVIEHETDVVFRLCDGVWVINEGTMIARGTPDEIRRDPQVLQLYFGEAAKC